MAKVYVSFFVPAGSEQIVGATSPLVPYPGIPTTDPPTHFGGNTLLEDTSLAYGSLVGTLATIEGSAYAATPFKQWTRAANWVAWLADQQPQGLQPQVLPLV